MRFCLAAMLTALLLCGACTAESDAPAEYETGPTIDRISVSIAGMTGAGAATRSGTPAIPDTVKIDTLYNIEELIPYDIEFSGSSVLQVSQKTRDTDPFQKDNQTYDFKFSEDYDATWDNEGSFNFVACDPDNPLDWNKIGAGGSWNGGFALFSLYFPDENSIREKEGDQGAMIYSVMEDQSTLQNLMRSDILGAYHSVPNLFSRIRFRMFHLMTYLRIRLYVPVYDDELNTGYRNGALLSATFNHVNPDFAIDWGVIRAGDTQGPAVSPIDGDSQIKMYQHPLPAGETEYPTTVIKYKDYLRDGYFDQGITGDYDTVRVYEFSVIIPNQSGSFDAKGVWHNNFAETDFLNFYFRSNSGATTRYYFTQALSANSNASTLEMNQGVFQYLQLYVPRVGNAVVYVGAQVKNWEQKGTEMLLTPEEEEQ